MIELISAILLAGSMPLANEADPDPVALRVQAYADEHVDKAMARSALAVGEHLLASAGVVVAWRVCDTAQSCPMGDTAVPEIVVILSSRDRQNGRENCGVAAHGARASAGTVMVSVPCVAGVAFRLTRRAGTGTNPLLAMPRHDDLIGAIVAHEIGHLLGIGHASTGLMRARLDSDDLIALRKGKLRFSPAESGRMRTAASLAREERFRSSAAGSPPNPSWQLLAVLPQLSAPSAQQSEALSPIPPWPCRLIVKPTLLGVLEDGWQRSPTLRRQCQELAEARALVVLEWKTTLDSQSRAITRMRRKPDGGGGAMVSIPPVSNAIELVAHELEHVLEWISGVDLAAESRRLAQKYGKRMVASNRKDLSMWVVT